MFIIFVPFASKLDPKVKKALKNGEYEADEIREIEKEVVEYHKTKKKGFIRAIIIAAGIFVLMAALSIPQMGNPVMLFTILITGVVLAAILMLVKWAYVDALKRQFVKAVRKGHPDFQFDLF